MTNLIKPLLERALKSDSEEEAINCIRQARKKNMSLDDIGNIIDIDFSSYIGKQVEVIDGKGITAWRAKALHFEKLLAKERADVKTSVDIGLINKISLLEEDLLNKNDLIEDQKRDLLVLSRFRKFVLFYKYAFFTSIVLNLGLIYFINKS